MVGWRLVRLELEEDVHTGEDEERPGYVHR